MAAISTMGAVREAGEIGAFVESDITTWTEADYRVRLAEVETLMNIPEDDPSADRLVTLAALVDDYENANYTIPEPSPEAVELHQREMRGEVVTPADWDAIARSRPTGN